MWALLLLLFAVTACGACGSPTVPPVAIPPAPERAPLPIVENRYCPRKTVAYWAADCQPRCIADDTAPILCHQIELPHAVLPHDTRIHEITIEAGTCPTDNGPATAWRVFTLRSEARMPEALDMNVGATWPGATMADCKEQPVGSDPDYFTNNPPPAGQAYYLLDEILPSE